MEKREMDVQIKLSNGQVLRGIINSHGENMRAGIILVHGIGEHILRYSHLVKKLNEKPVTLSDPAIRAGCKSHLP
jgi:sRNA-binding regulator protein Hfq